VRKNRKRREELKYIHPKKPPVHMFQALVDKTGEAIGPLPQFQFKGNREVIIDGCKGILEYDDTVVRITTGRLSLRFMGRNLSLKCLSDNSAVITGRITSVEFYGSE